jgi:hypothetical protein
MLVCAVVRTQSLVRFGHVAWEQGMRDYTSVVLEVDKRDALKNIDVLPGYSSSVRILGYHSSFYDGYVANLPVFEEILKTSI